MFGKYYNMDGKPISIDEWIATTVDEDSRRVASTKIWPGFWVSTVLLGLDHGFDDGPPVIFETMVFHRDLTDLDCVRYSTKKQALYGHHAMVNCWRRKRWGYLVCNFFGQIIRWFRRPGEPK